MITVDFFSCSDDNRKIDKNYYIVNRYVNCDVFSECDLYNPSLIVDSNIAISSNYIYIHNFDRYYFITNKIFDKGGKCTVECECDVLMSFKNAILNSVQLVVRSEDLSNEKVKNSRIADKLRPVTAPAPAGTVQVTDANTVTNEYYILTTIGSSVGKFADNSTPAAQGEYITLDDGTNLKLVKG